MNYPASYYRLRQANTYGISLLNPPKPLIFCDVDDVLVDFSKAAYELFDFVEQAEAMDRPRPPYAYKAIGVWKYDFWRVVSQVPQGCSEWWRTLPLTPWATKLIDHLNRLAGDDWRIATAPYNADGCKGRLQWIQEFAPNVRWHLTDDKTDLAMPGRLLIDDNENNCKTWVARGGDSILVPSPHNSNHHLPNYVVYDYITNQIERLGYADSTIRAQH